MLQKLEILSFYIIAYLHRKCNRFIYFPLLYVIARPFTSVAIFCKKEVSV